MKITVIFPFNYQGGIKPIVIEANPKMKVSQLKGNIVGQYNKQVEEKNRITVDNFSLGTEKNIKDDMTLKIAFENTDEVSLNMKMSGIANGKQQFSCVSPEITTKKDVLEQLAEEYSDDEKEELTTVLGEGVSPHRENNQYNNEEHNDFLIENEKNEADEEIIIEKAPCTSGVRKWLSLIFFCCKSTDIEIGTPTLIKVQNTPVHVINRK